MRQNIPFLKTSSVVVKITAWIFLVLGIIGGVTVLLGLVPDNPRWLGLIVLAVYAFSFFFLYLVARMSDILVEIIKEVKKE